MIWFLLKRLWPKTEVESKLKDRKSTSGNSRAHTRRWSADVTKHSDALTLDPGVFTLRDPRRIAASLKRSAERSQRRKGTPLSSAMSMLNFYLNRAGSKLSLDRKRILGRAKLELRKLFDHKHRVPI